MDDIPISALFGAIIILVLLSAFFSSSETAMMALNRYRLKHLSNSGDKAAMRAEKMLKQPDRLIGLILFGNNLVNFVAASIATILGMRLLGDVGVALAPFVLLFVFLIFAELMPKTVAALNPERIAFPATIIIEILTTILYPFVWVINSISNGLLSLFGIRMDSIEDDTLSQEELRSVVHEAGPLIPKRHKRMLLSILDLESMSVEDIMVPRTELVGIDLDDPKEKIIEQLRHCEHTRLPLFRDSMETIIGMVHARRLLSIMLNDEDFDTEQLLKTAKEPYFVPKGTPLNKQLLNFQKQKKRMGIVVDEYGVIQGLVTLEDILEEIVGEFTTNMENLTQDIQKMDEGFAIEGTITIRDINKQLKWDLPTDGAKTLNGLILEKLEDIPEAGTSLRLEHCTIEILEAADNAVKRAKLTLDTDSLEESTGS